jgi:hypothetical protein
MMGSATGFCHRHPVIELTQSLVNAQTGRVPIRQFSMSGYATYQDLAAFLQTLLGDAVASLQNRIPRNK